MPTSAKTLTAIGLAFVAGITAKSVLMPDSSAPVSAKLPKAAPAPASRVVRSDPAPGTWSDPIRSSDATVRPISRQATEDKPVFTAEPAAPPEAPDTTAPPNPPARPARLAASAGEIAAHKALESSRSGPRAHAYPPRALASSPSAETVRRAANQRQASRFADRRRDRPDYDMGYRPARFPDRSYAYTEDDSYGLEGDPDLGRGAWRGQAGPRVIARRGGGPDGLMDWLSQPGRRY